MIVSLRSLSLGTAWYEWTYDHLQEVPEKLTAAIAAGAREPAAA
jgi:elongation factor G